MAKTKLPALKNIPPKTDRELNIAARNLFTGMSGTFEDLDTVYVLEQASRIGSIGNGLPEYSSDVTVGYLDDTSWEINSDGDWEFTG